jgi:hypothetical protein
MSSFVLKTARSVKLSAFWTPFNGQLEGDVWRPTGEARESVARNDAKKTVVNMISSRSGQVVLVENAKGRLAFIRWHHETLCSTCLGRGNRMNLSGDPG